MTRSFRIFLAASIAIVTLGSCNGYERVLKNPDLNYRLTKANEFYDKKKWGQAMELYKSLIPPLKGTKNYEPLYYRYCYSFYYLKDYLQASYHFKNFIEYFPTSRDAEECEYMHALCLFKEAPKASLEQTNTVRAMGAMQSFVNQHPGSRRVAEASKIIDEGRRRLEEKEAGSAKLYFQIGQWKAASVAYASVLRAYPESAAADLYQLMIVRSLYNYAQQSISEKQEERYASVVAEASELKELYPTSSYLPEADRFSALAQSSISNLRK